MFHYNSSEHYLARHMRNNRVNLAIVGVTGAVGTELLKVLEKRDFPIDQLRCFASPRSANQTIGFRGKSYSIETLSKESFEGIDIALFSAGKKNSLEWAPIASRMGVCVIDNSSAFRMDPAVPLVIPEINPHAIQSSHSMIASPNCSTTIMLMALAPLHRKHPIARIVAATYQAASGAGKEAMRELEEETLALLRGNSFERRIIPHPYAFNLFTHNSSLTESGYVEEELKMLYETRKILEDETIGVHATCVRVPVLRAHAEALNVSFREPIEVEEAYEILQAAPGLKILEDRISNRFPMPSDATCQDDVYYGRIRKDPSFPHTLDLWVVGDQLLKGAALNTVQIAELILRRTSCADSCV